MAWLLDRYSSAYASNQYRALQQFFKWLTTENPLCVPRIPSTALTSEFALPAVRP